MRPALDPPGCPRARGPEGGDPAAAVGPEGAPARRRGRGPVRERTPGAEGGLRRPPSPGEAGGPRGFRARPWRLAPALLLATACGGAPPPAPALDWLLGDWHGIRRSTADGTEAPLAVHIESLRGGPEQIERLQVRGSGAPYTGFAVHAPAGEAGRWLMLYGNSTRPGFSRLDGEVGPGRVTWRSAALGRARRSRVVVERLDADHWRRTNHVSEDGGKSWRVLFTDELERDGAPQQSGPGGARERSPGG